MSGAHSSLPITSTRRAASSRTTRRRWSSPASASSSWPWWPGPPWSAAPAPRSSATPDDGPGRRSRPPPSCRSRSSRSPPADGATSVASDARSPSPYSVPAVGPLARADPRPRRSPAPGAGRPDDDVLRGRRARSCPRPRDHDRARRHRRHPGRRRPDAWPRARPSTSPWPPAAPCGSSSCWPSSATCPVGFTPAGPLASPQELAQPQQGTFAWRFAEPAALTSQWTPGTVERHHQGRGHGLRGQARHDHRRRGRARGVGRAARRRTAGTVDTAAYNYVYVTKTLPERATVYSNGAVVYSTPANTGVGRGPTATAPSPSSST